ncbi:hypothetical protein B484DRAFT_2943 [Ochromonadaceae sp. CCMP2298]|nr:hypothetical protein B484DRAFT_2943 [Ochromonadaceae sp. CCMP2298]
MINPKISKRGGGGYAAAEQAGEISNGMAARTRSTVGLRLQLVIAVLLLMTSRVLSQDKITEAPTLPPTATPTCTPTAAPTLAPTSSSVRTYRVSYAFTGGEQSFQVPDGTTSVSIVLYAAQGGGTLGGFGASITGTISVVAAELLRVYVGGQGGATGAAGFNGGGTGYGSSGTGGGGGTDIRRLGMLPLTAW